MRYSTFLVLFAVACADAPCPRTDAGRAHVDASVDAGVGDSGRGGCVDVEDIFFGYELDDRGCALVCPWADPACPIVERGDCLTALQTAAGPGTIGCDAWAETLTSPLCTEACR